MLAAFVCWQARNRREPLVPLSLFADRNFSLSNVAIATVGFAFTAMGFPLMLWAQVVRGYSPTESGLLLAPMALMSIVPPRSAGSPTGSTRASSPSGLRRARRRAHPARR